ncbi:hypothetical protein [Curtobacterium sp. SORGH_AS_0776]|uniref:hypothetical protein n=1 Tax=Curtobacterium sp. SORGH_AS_0776 TaxID=3041798 RepID=UPI002860AA2C|nr:hypothetical protein [Curtobacterium sp. SORGH_AS_0776]MDR6171398.1 hypothetical protein [Curtobacterium sp. SORGH_AS_0776]
MADAGPATRVEVDTEDAARARARLHRAGSKAGSGPWTTVLVTAWIVLVVAFVAISVFENAFRYRAVGASFLIASAWTLPPLLVLHGTHAAVVRPGGPRARRRDAPFDRAAARVVTESRAAGFPDLDVAAVVRMLRSADNGPDPGTGERGMPDWPLLRWELPLAPRQPGRFVVAERRSGPERGSGPERTVLTLVEHPTEPPVPRTAPSVAEHLGTIVLGAYRPDAPAPFTASRIGGAPAVPEGWEWPLCAHHDEPMQFTAQIEHRETLVSVFVCQFDPGTCASWEPDSGANAAFVFSLRGLHLAAGPVSPHGDPDDPEPASPPLLADAMLLRHVPVPMVHDDEDPDRVLAAAAAEGVLVAGQYGGLPEWIQDDETPAGTEFVASIEPGLLGFDFGDAGRAYVFSDGARASVLWQTS